MKKIIQNSLAVITALTLIITFIFSILVLGEEQSKQIDKQIVNEGTISEQSITDQKIEKSMEKQDSKTENNPTKEPTFKKEQAQQKTTTKEATNKKNVTTPTVTNNQQKKQSTLTKTTRNKSWYLVCYDPITKNRLKNAEIKLHRVSDGAYYEYSSDNEGLIWPGLIEDGFYELRGIKTPDPYFNPTKDSTKAMSFRLPKGDKKYTRVQIDKGDLYVGNQYQEYLDIPYLHQNSIEFSSQLIEFNGKKLALPNISYLVEQSANNDKFSEYQKITSDINGKFTLKNLQPGYYRLTPNKLASHYQIHQDNLDTRYIYVSRSKFQIFDPQANEYIRMKNYHLSSEEQKQLTFQYQRDNNIAIRVNKVDEEGNPIQTGAEFTVTSGQDYTESKTTNEAGYLDFKKIPLDKAITITETKAPAGYLIDNTTHKIDLNKNYQVPTDLTKAKDVSALLEVTSFKTDVTKLDPIASESIPVETTIKIAKEGRLGENRIKPGDYFTYYYEGLVSLGGIIPEGEQYQGLNIRNAIGDIAQGKFIRDENGCGYRFYFTNYVEDLCLNESFEVENYLYIDLYQVLKSQPVAIATKIGNNKSKPLEIKGKSDNKVMVDYGSDGTGTQADITIASKIMKWNKLNYTIEETLYINPLGSKSSNYHNLHHYTISQQTDTGLINQNAEIQIYQVNSRNKENMPVSYGVDVTKSIYQNVTKNFTIKKTANQISIDMNQKYNHSHQGHGYVIKAVYHYDKQHIPTTNIDTYHKLTFNDDGWVATNNFLEIHEPITAADAYLELTYMNQKEPQNNLVLTKQGFSSQGTVISEALAGVEFKVEYQDAEGNWQLFTQKPCNESGLATTNDEGQLVFENLNTKTKELVKYRIFETKAAPGYILPADQESLIEFQVNPDKNRSITITKNGTQDEEHATENIIKNQAIEYPATGGRGYLLYLVSGGLLMSSAIIRYYKK